MLIEPFPNVENVYAGIIPMGNHDLITANFFIVGKGPVVLIDTGLKYPGSLDHILDGLKAVNLGLDDVEKILVTHGHLDHYGQVVDIREAAGRDIPCFVHPEDSWRIASKTYRADLWREETDRFMAMVDMPPEGLEEVKNRFRFFDRLCDPVANAVLMEDGDEFSGNGYDLKVIHTPGHSPGSVCFYEPRQKVLFSGDHIIKHITPNPLVEIRRDRLRNPDYQSLHEFFRSQKKLEGYDIRYVFPAHGEYVADLPSLQKSYRKHHRQRMDKVWEALNKESRPLYHIIDDVFPHVPEGDLFFAVSEIFVHLEILMNEGRVELADPGPPAYYRALP
ncbi:MAG: MBL fold metallo-hydrolase [Proteobacteria bacterium]|nr:MBL fold metallo-hydrolase [Pseudomonadota bacterium]